MSELQHILMHKGIEENEAKARIEAYEEHNNQTSIAALKYSPGIYSQMLQALKRVLQLRDALPKSPLL